MKLWSIWNKLRPSVEQSRFVAYEIIIFVYNKASLEMCATTHVCKFLDLTHKGHSSRAAMNPYFAIHLYPLPQISATYFPAASGSCHGFSLQVNSFSYTANKNFVKLVQISQTGENLVHFTLTERHLIILSWVLSSAAQTKVICLQNFIFRVRITRVDLQLFSLNQVRVVKIIWSQLVLLRLIDYLNFPQI